MDLEPPIYAFMITLSFPKCNLFVSHSISLFRSSQFFLSTLCYFLLSCVKATFYTSGRLIQLLFNFNCPKGLSIFSGLRNVLPQRLSSCVMYCSFNTLIFCLYVVQCYDRVIPLFIFSGIAYGAIRALHYIKQVISPLSSQNNVSCIRYWLF